MSNQPRAQKQSRIGKMPVEVPAGVNVTINGQLVAVKGPKGETSREFPAVVQVQQEGSVLRLAAKEGSGKEGTQYQGLSRALLNNMVTGVSAGFKTYLDLHGVGYRADVKGSDLTMSVGLSHQVKMTLPNSVKAKVETIDEGGTKRPRIHLESHDKEALGQVAARLRAKRPPEPYKGKGIRVAGERIRQKAGKAGGK